MAVRFDPMEDVIDQMPEPSSFADQITANGAHEDAEPSTGSGGVSNGDDLNFDSPSDSEPTSNAAPAADERFDPNIHCVNDDGTPRLTKTGKFRRKRGKANAQPTPSLTEPDPVRMAKAKAAAQVSTAATFIAGQIIFGPEGEPIDGEPQRMTDAYTQFYFLSENPIEIQPWMMVAMVVGTYAASRMQMEKPRGRVVAGFTYMSDKVKAAWTWVSTGWF